MRRLARHLFTLALAVSLLLAVAVGGLWVRSYARVDVAGYSHHAPPAATALDWGYHLTSGRGVLTLGHYVDHFTDPVAIASQARERYASRWFWDTHAAVTPAPRWLGFNGCRNTYPYGTNRNWQVAVPHALPCAVALTLPLAAFAHRQRRRRRVVAGACLACGYDLRASPERCPECGTATNAV